MKNAVTLTQVENKLITIRGESVLLDSDVAALYAVQTREVNQAIKNNPDKFPKGYIISLNKSEWAFLKSQIVTSGGNIEKEAIKNFDRLQIKFTSGSPKAFTEKGLYMLATILKGERAVQTTLAIVEAFAKIRELARTVA